MLFLNKILWRIALVAVGLALVVQGQLLQTVAPDTTNTDTATGGSDACVGPRTPGELRTQLLTDYDKYARPNLAESAEKGWPLVSENGGAPMADIARVQFHVLVLKDVDQKRNEYQLTVWFRRSWLDRRLSYTPASQGGCFPDDGRVGYPESLLQDIWKPDYYIENQAKPPVWTAGSLWIEPNGEVLWSSQVELTIACGMEFKDFPFDIQKCGIRISTYMDDASAVQLEFFPDMEPVTLASDNNSTGDDIAQGGTTEWSIAQASGTTKSVDIGAESLFNAYSYVDIRLDLQRNHDYYSAFVLVPAVMFVLIGWLSFFIGRAAAPARVAMSMIGFLANMNFLSAQLGQLPKLGNEVWLLKFLYVSSFFSFYAILEYVLCNYLGRIEARLAGVRKKAEELKESKKASLPEEAPATNNKSDDDTKLTKADIIATGFNRKVDLLIMNPSTTRMYLKDEHVEIFSRYSYPITYVIATVVLYYQ